MAGRPPLPVSTGRMAPSSDPTARFISATPTTTASARWRVSGEMRVLARIAAIGALTLAGAAIAQESGAAVTTSGSGVLTICRDWLVYNSCTTYNVAVPKRVGVGDSILLTYGSNPKDYNFRVLRIRRDGEGCTI